MTKTDLCVVPPKPGMEANAAGSDAKEDKKMTEDVKLDEEDKIRKAKKKDKTKAKKEVIKKKPRYYFWNPDALSNLAGSGRRTKKILVSVTKEFVDHLKHNNPLPPAHVPTRTGCWMTDDDEIQDIVAAQDKADQDKRDKVISDFEVYGHAEMEYEVTDDEAEAAEV